MNTCPNEYFFWHGDYDKDVVFPKEWFAAFSGLALFLLSVFGPPAGAFRWRNALPVEYWLANAGLAACGIGTFMYHGSDGTDDAYYGINTYMWDGFTMALLVGNTMLLFLSQNAPYAAALHTLYLFFFAYSNDLPTYTFLNRVTNDAFCFGVQYPLFVVPYAAMNIACMVLVNGTALPLFTTGLVAVAAWLIDRFVCVPFGWLGHTVWHLSIGYNAALLMCFALHVRGLTVRGRWRPELLQPK